jgi:NADPH2:quinone reductase
VIFGWAGGRNVIDTSPFGYYGITVMPFSSLAWTGTKEDHQGRELVREWLATEELLQPTVYPLAEIVEAERALEEGRTVGKVVLRVCEENGR